jgi:hypothetical protein
VVTKVWGTATTRSILVLRTAALVYVRVEKVSYKWVARLEKVCVVLVDIFCYELNTSYHERWLCDLH